MDPFPAMGVACFLHLALTGARFLRPPRGTGTATDGAATVVVAVATVLFLGNVDPLGLRVVAMGAATAAALGAHWQAFRQGRFGRSLAVDTGAVCAETAACIWALLGLAQQLYPAAPFGAVLTGILGFFLPVNAAAEIFRTGREAVSRGR